MARPEKQNADYFSHDNNMRDDPKVKYIRNLYGLPGYAVYCMLLEYLCYSDGLKVERNDHHKKLICGDFGVSREQLCEFVDQMIDIELLILADGYIYSQGLNDRLQIVFDKRIAAKNRFLGQKGSGHKVSATGSTQSKVKESKVKESKEEKEIEKKSPPQELQSIKNILSDQTLIDTRGLDILEEFVIYWGEPNKKGKEKWLEQKTWDLDGRLRTWKKNKITNFGRKVILDYEDINNFHVAINAGKLEDIKEFFRNKYGTKESKPGRQIRQDKYAETKEKRKNSPLFTAS